MVDSSRRQVFRPGELPLVMLALLDQQPRNGYELMAEMKRLFDGAYRPSAGGIYPARAALLDEGLIEPVTDGERNRYAVTDTGRNALAARAAALAELEERTGVRITEASSLAPVLERFASRIRRVSGHVGAERVEKILDETARKIEKLAEGRSR